MELVYLVNGNESGEGGGGGSSGGYPFVKAVVQDGVVGIQDRTVTRVELKTSDAVRINFPPKTEGIARDFLLRLVITADDVPEVTFAVPTGETFSFEEGEDDSFTCLVGVNIFAFTETESGSFVVNRKLVSIAQTVTFDPDGGTIDVPSKDYLLGAKYGALPVPAKHGFVFAGWRTEDGVEVKPTDTVKTSVTQLVAAWDAYVDVFAPAICESGDLVFTTEGDAKWTLSDDVDGHGIVAQSGPVGDNQQTSLFTEVAGSGTLSFAWKVSSEANFDKAYCFIDGVQKTVVHGENPWAAISLSVSGSGEHSVEWRYKKDDSVARGSDCVWLDNVSWRVS